MDQLLKQYSQRTVIPTGQYNGAMYRRDDAFSTSDSSSSEDEDREKEELYEQEYVQAEMKKYAEIIQQQSIKNNLCDVDDVDVDNLDTNAWNIYDQYNFASTLIKKELPIDSFKQKILGLININTVIILQGPTGCGKTTQVPQYILDDCRARAEMCNIVITQPRRIAAINVARRVCEERGWTLGTVCGYQVALEKQTSPDMLLKFVTTGVLLQMIIRAKSLRQFSHIIIDEVHERNYELDFLLLIVRKFLFTNSPETKVILMSATFEAKEFAHYFRYQNHMNEFQAPIIYIDKNCNFKKQVFYCDQLSITTVPKLDIDKPEIHPEMWTMFRFLIKAFDKLDTVDPTTNEVVFGSILVFLPGLHEIEEAHKRLISTERDADRIKWDIIPLHSSLPNDEQAKVFKPRRAGYRKIILSTNIAESSITVPDTTYVIDFCLTKVMTADPVTQFLSLKLEWASHVNCEQRAGRVGRVSNGRVYRLVSRNFYEFKMAKKNIPEMLRAPLERIVLQAKMLELNDTPKQVLALAINPPSLQSIESTVWQLKEVGGLLLTCRGMNCAADGDLTFLGTVMASLPLDVNLSKLILLGHMFSCLEEAIIIAAGCSVQKIFSIPFQQKFNAYKKMLLWADDSESDLIALLNLYNVWQLYKRENNFENHHSEFRWCTLNFVSLKGLKEWQLLVSEIKERLQRLKIVDTMGPGKLNLTATEKPIILKIITSAAFYPNYFIRGSMNGQIDKREAVRCVAGRDPLNTVYFTGMDPSQPGELYVRAIKRMIVNRAENEDDVYIGFDGSCKVFVEFKKATDIVSVNMDGQQILTTMQGKIPLAVYESVRKRQLKYTFPLKLLPNKEAWAWAHKFGVTENKTTKLRMLENDERGSFEDFSPFPSLDTEFIKIIITSRTDPSCFYIQNFDNRTNILLKKIYDILNKQVLHPVEKQAEPGLISVGQTYAAKFTTDGKFYRCQIISFSPDVAQVRFIDYGNLQNVKMSELFKLPNREECFLAPLAMECRLKGVRPALGAPRWSEEINRFFDEQTQNIVLHGKVFSVVNDVVCLELYRSQPTESNSAMSLNQWMTKNNMAQECQESYLSRENHQNRVEILSAENRSLEVSKIAPDKITSYADFYSPKIGNDFTTVHLGGPYSPLEMKLYGCIDSATNKNVQIEGTSVNTVLLDTEPEDCHTRLLVARHVGQSADGYRLMLRQTTMMPNIPGFPMLMALMFCPTMEPKLTSDGTRVASILCGLGCDKKTQEPYYQSHDMVLVLDTELEREEIELVNKIRYLMNNYIRIMKDISHELATPNDLLDKQRLIKDTLFCLIQRERKSVEQTNVEFSNVWRKTALDALILRSNITDDPDDVWPLLWFVKVKNADAFDPLIAENLEELTQIAKKMIPAKPINCELCQEHLLTIFEVINHIISPLHKERYAHYSRNLYEDEEDDEDEDDNDEDEDDD